MLEGLRQLCNKTIRSRDWKPLRKVIWTLNINNYLPELLKLTYPYMVKYAEKIDADFRIIDERKFPDFPPAYEKLQIHELGHDNDWNIFFDADTLVHPDLFDVTELMPSDTVMHWACDFSGNRWKYDKYLSRDNRHIGSGNWFAVAPKSCINLWEPLDISLEEALRHIYPTVHEVNMGITAEHLIDDFTLSRNIAKYGLKFVKFTELLASKGIPTHSYLAHNYNWTPEQKIESIKATIRAWELEGPSKTDVKVISEVGLGSAITIKESIKPKCQELVYATETS